MNLDSAAEPGILPFSLPVAEAELAGDDDDEANFSFSLAEDETGTAVMLVSPARDEPRLMSLLPWWL